MTDLFARGTRIAAVAALTAITAVGTAQATDWDQLQGSGWDAGGKDTEGMASSTADAAAGGNRGAEIAGAFQDLGMEPARAECYGGILSEQLSPEEQERAAELVRTASNGEEVRMSVLDAGPEIVGGFSAADASCPEGMGG